MNNRESAETILLADVGSTLTHVVQIGMVEGQYRLVAQAQSPTTVGEPEIDLTVGLRRAIRKLEHTTRRRLLDDQGELICPEQASGTGVDLMVATTSAAPPLRGIIVGLTDDLSVHSARKACSAANVDVVRTISVGTRLRRWDDQALISMRQYPPDVILLVGGVDTGPVAPIESAARVLAALYGDIPSERRPVVIFAGNQEARRPISVLLGSSFDLHAVDNVHPRAQVENLAELKRELADLYERIKLSTLPGYRRLRRWCGLPVRATAQTLGVVIAFLAQHLALPQGIMGADVGGGTTHLGAAHLADFQWVIGSGLGTGMGIDEVLASSSLADIVRWLPYPLASDEALARLKNARLRPHSVPQTMEDVHLGLAVARQAMALTLRLLYRQGWRAPGITLEERLTPALDWIVARGTAIVQVPTDGLAALAIIDALQPVGITRLSLDWASVLPQLGALAPAAPRAAWHLLQRDGMRHLGVVIAPLGAAREGERALHLRLRRGSGQVITADVPAGMVQRFPLHPGEEATVELHTARSFDLGPSLELVTGRSRVLGGSLGLIVDTRGRPLSLPQNPELRRIKAQQWGENLTGARYTP